MVIGTIGGTEVTRVLFNVCNRNVSSFSSTESSRIGIVTHCVLLVTNAKLRVSDTETKSSSSVYKNQFACD